MIEDLAARQRAEAKAATQRRAKRQGDAAFWDGQGAADSGGNSIPVTTGSNGPLRLGQSAPLLQGGGSAQIDTFSAMRSDEPLIPVISGRVMVLAYTEKNGIYEVWIGGDRKTPLKIAETPIQLIPQQRIRLKGWIEVLGTGRNDWAVALQYGNTIKMIYGSPSPDRQSWEITDPACDFLEYQGAGFWCTPFIYLYDLGYYGTEIQLPDRPRNDATLVREGYHGSTGGESTHSIEYYETIYVGGDNPSLFERGTRKSGFDNSAMNDFPYLFGGLNEEDYISEYDEREYTGDAYGPGYLGPGGESCDINDPTTITRTYSIPRFRRKAGTIYRRELNSQSYSFCAYSGNLELKIGTDTYFYKNEEFYEVTTGPFSGEYFAFCQEYTTAYLWSIGATGTGEPPTFRDITDHSNVSLSTSIQRRIAPGLTEDIQISRIEPQPPGSAQNRTEATFWESRGCIFPGSGTFYQKITHLGSFNFRRGGARPNIIYPPYDPNIAGTRIANFFIYKGVEVEIADNSELKSASFIAWKDEGGVFPNAYDLFPAQGFSEENIFSKEIKYDVNKYEGTLISSTLSYRSSPAGKEKALPMRIGPGTVLSRKFRG